MSLWGWSRQSAAVLGSSRQSWTALLATLCLAMVLASFPCRLIARKLGHVDVERLAIGFWLSCLSVVALFSVFPSLSTELALAGLGRLAAPSVLTALPLRLGLLIMLCAAGWLIPMTAAVGLLTASSQASLVSSGEPGRKLWLAAAGVLACELLAAALGGMDRALLIAGLFGTYAFSVALWNVATSVTQKSEFTAGQVDTMNGSSREAATREWWFHAAQIFLLGALWLFLTRLISQLVLPVSWVSATVAAALVGGVSLGGLLFRTRTLTTRFSRSWRVLNRAEPVFVALAAGLLAVIVFEPLVWLVLRINAELASVALSTCALVAIVALVIGPVGVAVGGLLERSADARSSAWVTTGEFLLFMAGLISARWLAPGIGSASAAILLTLTVLTAVSLAGQIQKSSWRVVLRPQWVGGLASLALTIGLVNPQEGAALAARLLFDTRVFLACQVEERTETLPYLDEGRCVAVSETDSGPVTIWKRRACEFEVRRSGVPLGAVSLDTFIVPHRTGEILQAVLPLCLHREAQNVLLIGAGSGAVIETCAFFPLRDITCVEPDENYFATLSRHILSQMPLNPLDDERVRVVAAEPTLAVRLLPGPFDIVLSSVSQPAFADAEAVTSSEFLSAAAQTLSEDGLFCQPLDIVDFGPAALGCVVQTWQSVFADVTAFEIGPGRLLLVGRLNVDSSNRFDGKGFLERLQRPHVRAVLADLGWDWSTVLKVMAYSHADLQRAFPADGSRPGSVINALFSATLPFEVTRWGPKYQHTLARLSQVAGTMQFLTGTAGQDPEIKRRLADLDEQADLIHDKPDHYWAYRGRLKERIKKAPQSELVQVKGEAPYHTLSGTEKRRLEYFETLGVAAQQERPTAEALNAVAEFETPFDPLLSPFLHQEIAELAERDPQRLGSVEFWHRLHRAFFASPTDRSVRNVARAIELLDERPELIADPAARGDSFDALLQILHDRWHNRGDIAPDSSQIVLNDIEASLSAIESAFGQLAELSDVRGLPADAWLARKLAVEKSLVRPLEAYRSMLLPRHVKRQLLARPADKK